MSAELLSVQELTAVLLGQMLDLVAHASHNDREACLQLVASSLGHTLGYFEGMLVLSGYTKESRSALREHALVSGKGVALQDHDAICSSCDPGEVLRAEVQPR